MAKILEDFSTLWRIIGKINLLSKILLYIQKLFYLIEFNLRYSEEFDLTEYHSIIYEENINDLFWRTIDNIKNNKELKLLSKYELKSITFKSREIFFEIKLIPEDKFWTINIIIKSLNNNTNKFDTNKYRKNIHEIMKMTELELNHEFHSKLEFKNKNDGISRKLEYEKYNIKVNYKKITMSSLNLFYCEDYIRIMILIRFLYSRNALSFFPTFSVQ